MTRRIGLSTLAFLTILAASGRATGQDKVTGRVVTADGKPAAGAVVGTHWTYAVGDPRVSIADDVVADADGRFTLETRFPFGRSRPILALAADEQLAIGITREEDGGMLEGTLGRCGVAHAGWRSAQSVDRVLRSILPLGLRGSGPGRTSMPWGTI